MPPTKYNSIGPTLEKVEMMTKTESQMIANLPDSLRELHDTFAYKEFVQLIEQVFT